MQWFFSGVGLVCLAFAVFFALRVETETISPPPPPGEIRATDPHSRRVSRPHPTNWAAAEGFAIAGGLCFIAAGLVYRPDFSFVPARQPRNDVPDELAHRALRSALEKLPGSLRRVLLLSELGGLSYGEIASIMNIREGTVGSRRSRALAELRRTLAARGVDWHEG